MDYFGIGAAIKGALNIYFQSARQSGRTTALLDGLKDGDRVYFASYKELKHFQNKCRVRGLDIECIVIPIKEYPEALERPPSKGRTVLSHEWVEEFYKHRINQAQLYIDYMEKESSGTVESRQETKQCAIEVQKWSYF